MTLLEKALTTPPDGARDTGASLHDDFIELALAYVGGEIDRGQLATALKRTRQDAHHAAGVMLMRAIKEGKVMVMRC